MNLRLIGRDTLRHPLLPQILRHKSCKTLQTLPDKGSGIKTHEHRSLITKFKSLSNGTEPSPVP